MSFELSLDRQANCLQARATILDIARDDFTKAVTDKVETGRAAARSVLGQGKLVELLCSDSPVDHHVARLAMPQTVELHVTPYCEPAMAVRAELETVQSMLAQQQAAETVQVHPVSTSFATAS